MNILVVLFIFILYVVGFMVTGNNHFQGNSHLYTEELFGPMLADLINLFGYEVLHAAKWILIGVALLLSIDFGNFINRDS